MPHAFDFDANQTELCRLKNDRLMFLIEIQNWKGNQTSTGLEKLKQQLYLCDFRIAENEKAYERAIKKRISGMIQRHK
jgi:hypothetical protein